MAERSSESGSESLPAARSMPQVAGGPRGMGGMQAYEPRQANLADILERVLDKGIVIAGDISVSLVDVELLTIKIRLLVASVDRAKEMGIDWWERDPMLSTRAQDRQSRQVSGGQQGELESSESSQDLQEENARLRARIEELENGS